MTCVRLAGGLIAFGTVIPDIPILKNTDVQWWAALHAGTSMHLLAVLWNTCRQISTMRALCHLCQGRLVCMQHWSGRQEGVAE